MKQSSAAVDLILLSLSGEFLDSAGVYSHAGQTAPTSAIGSSIIEGRSLLYFESLTSVFLYLLFCKAATLLLRFPCSSDLSDGQLVG